MVKNHNTPTSYYHIKDQSPHSRDVMLHLSAAAIIKKLSKVCYHHYHRRLILPVDLSSFCEDELASLA